MKELTTEIVTESEDFVRLRDEWNLLLSRSQSNTLFLTWEWLSNWWKIFGQNRALWILLVRRNARLVGIAPFCLDAVRFLKFLPAREVEFLGCDSVGSDYLDFIVEAGYEGAVMEAICDFLHSRRATWDLIRLTSLPSSSKNLSHLKHHGRARGFCLHVRDHTLSPYISLPETWDAFLASLSKNMRYNVKRRRRQLSRDYNAEFYVLRDKAELPQAVDDFSRLNRMRMITKQHDAAFLSENFSDFHRTIMPILFDKGFLTLCFIKINHVPISGLYVFSYNRTYLYYQAGFDPHWYRLSPGLVLFSYCIENAIAEGMKEFDFLQGEEEYKYKWTNDFRKNLELVIARDALVPRSLLWVEVSMRKGKQLAKRML